MANYKDQRRRFAFPIGDPAGIGCEVTLKALARADVRAVCAPVVVGDAKLVSRCNNQFGTDLSLRIVSTPGDLAFDEGAVEVLDITNVDAESHEFGVVSAANGRALIEYGQAAIRLARDGVVDGVLAAPHNQTSVKQAGIVFDGYNQLVADTLGLPADDLFLMVVSNRFRIAHVTLHVSLRRAIEQARRDRIMRTIRATDEALRRMGIARPRIAVSGLNPHASENGLFGGEEAAEIVPAVREACAAGIDAHGPFGADVMLARGGYDGYVVMLHDQGHIPAKLERGSAGFCIGAPILFGTVAHGSAHDIAGRGIADPTNMINLIFWSVGTECPSAGA